MNTQKNRPGLLRASDFIIKRIASGYWKQGAKLPAIRLLAAMAGVSKATMAKACEMLKEKQVVSGDRQHRLQVGNSQSNNTGLINENTLIWQRKRSLFQKDLLSGKFGTGKLPSTKELEFRYQVNFRTMQKILHALENDGVLQSAKKSYFFSSMQNRTRGTRIIFITFMGFISQQSALNKDHNRIARLFESECIRRGMQLEIVEIDFYDSAKTGTALRAIVDSVQVAGFILDLWWYTSPGFRKSYSDALAHCASFGKPMAILDELAGFDLPVQFEKNPGIQVYTIEGEKAGDRMAGYLAGLGHQSAVFISQVHHQQWSQERFNGIARRFFQCGLAENLHCVSDTFYMPMPAMLSAAGLNDNEVRRLLAIGRTPSQAADLEKTWQEYNLLPEPKTAMGDDIKPQLKKNLTSLATMLDQNFDTDFQTDICTSAIITAGKRQFISCLKALFTRALSLPGVTLWI
jgi:DNA-binding transcriptional regulator YhcF (GntR family)